MAFWISCQKKAMKEQMDEEIVIIKMFASNYARDLVFRIDPLPARGFHKISAIVLLSVLLYQLMVYYNCKTEKINPKSIKYILGTG
jgi:hypothetical protein